MKPSIQQIGFVYNAQIPEAIELCKSLIKALKISNNSWSSSAELVSEKEKEFTQTSLIIVLGGDGTILSTVRRLEENMNPIMGIHIGGLGFLSECTESNLDKSINYIVKDEYSISERIILMPYNTSMSPKFRIGTLFE